MSIKKVKSATSAAGSFAGAVVAIALFIGVLVILAFFIFSTLHTMETGVMVGRVKGTSKLIYVFRENNPVLFYFGVAALSATCIAAVLGLILLLTKSNGGTISTSLPMRIFGQVLLNFLALGSTGYFAYMAWEPVGRYGMLALMVVSAWRLNAPGVSLLRPLDRANNAPSAKHERL